MKLLLLSTATVALAAPALQPRTTPISPTDWNELHRAALLSSAAYSDCQNSAFNVTIVQQINNLITDTQGFIGHDDVNKRISVVMRGSTTPQDLLNDVDTTPVTPTLSGVKFPPGTQVMRGIVRPWGSVHEQVVSTVASLIALYPDYRLEVLGHSLGGSLTYLGHVAVAQNFPNSTIVSNALAPFPIGNQIFATFGQGLGYLRRGDNTGDGVPNMWPQFTHYGTEFYGPGVEAKEVKCVGERDPACSAGDGAFTPDVQHFSNSGVTMLLAGCGH